MGGGPDNVKQTTTSDVPEWVKPYLQKYGSALEQLYMPGGNLSVPTLPTQAVAPFSPDQFGAFDTIRSMGTTAPYINQSQNFLSDFLGSGSGIGNAFQFYSNPYAPFDNPSITSQMKDPASVYAPLGNPGGGGGGGGVPKLTGGGGSPPGDFSSFTGKAENPYLRPYFDQASRALTDTYQNVTAPNVLAQGIATGTLGSTGNVFDDALKKYELGQNLASLSAQIYEPAYEKERELQFGAASAMDQGSIARQGLANQLSIANMYGGLEGQSLANQLAIAQGSQGLQAQALQGSLAEAQMNAQLAARGLGQNALQNYMGDILQGIGIGPGLLQSSYYPAQQLLGVGALQQQQGQNLLNTDYQNQYAQSMFPYQLMQQYGSNLGTLIGSGGTQVSVGPNPSGGGKGIF